VLIGTTEIGANLDSSNAGRAKAFQYTASNTGSLTRLVVYLDNQSASTSFEIGIYTNTGSENPGTLLVKGKITNPVVGQWNSIDVPGTSLVAGTKYWIAVLSPYRSGTLRIRDVLTGGKSQISLQNNLTTLPSTWSPGKNSKNSPLSAYGR
jgi:hypothetical protein